MPDDVLGKVTIEVDGDTRPLARDIKETAHKAGQGVGPEVAAGINEDDSITDAIVDQVDDAEKPSEESGRKVGRAVVRGTRRGVRDEEPGLGKSLDRMFSGIGRSLERESQTLSAGFKRMGAQARSAFDDEAGNIRKASGDAGATISPEIARGINRTPAITEAIVGQVDDAIAPADESGELIGRSVVRGARRGVRSEEPTLRQSLDNLFGTMSESLERESPRLAAGFHRIGAQVRDVFQSEAGSIQQDISDAAHEAGTDVGPEVAAGINADAGITDAIVGQVTDAVDPSEDAGVDVGHAVMRGTRRGIRDEQADIASGLRRMFGAMGDSLARETPIVTAGFRRLSAQVREVFTDESSALRREAVDAGGEIGPAIAAGVDDDSAITEAIVAQVDDAVVPVRQAGHTVGVSGMDGVAAGIDSRKSDVGGLLGDLFGDTAASLDRGTPAVEASLQQMTERVRDNFAERADEIGQISTDLGESIGPNMAAGIGDNDSALAALVESVSDAINPVQEASREVGRASVEGMREGVRDGAPGLADEVIDAYAGLGERVQRETREQIMGGLRAGTVAGATGGGAPLTDAIVAQVEDAVTPVGDAGEEAGRSLVSGIVDGADSQDSDLAVATQRMTDSLREHFRQSGAQLSADLFGGIADDNTLTGAITENIDDAADDVEAAGRRTGQAAGRALVSGIVDGADSQDDSDLVVAVQHMADSLREHFRESGANLAAELFDGIADDDSLTEAITENVDDAADDAEAAGRRTGQAAGRGVRKGAEEELSDALKGVFENLDRSLGKRTDTVAKAARERIKEILRADPSQRSALAENLIGPDLMNDLRATLNRFNDLVNTSGPHIEINEGDYEKVLNDIDILGGRISAKFEAHGEEGGKSFQGGMQKGLKKAVSGGIFDAMFKTLALKVGGLGSLIAFGVRAAAPIIVGLTSQITTAIVGLSQAVGGLGIVGVGIGATLLPNMIALKFAMKGLDTDAKKALAKNFKEAAGELAKFPDLLRSTLIPRLIDAVKIVRQLSPEISKFGKATGVVAGDIAKNLAGAFASNRGSIDAILTGSNQAFARLGEAAVSLMDPLLDALAVMQPLIKDAVDSIADGIEGLAERLDKSVESGRFLDTLERWYDSGKTLLQGFKNLGIVVFNFFKVANNSQDNFVESFEKFTGKWAEWTGSIGGQNRLREMFEEAQPVVEEVWGLLGDIVGLFTESLTGDTDNLVGFIQSIREDFIPMMEDLQDIVRDSGIQDALYDLSRAFLDLLQAGGGGVFAGFVTTLGNMVEVLAKLLDIFGPVLGPFLTFIGGVKALSLISSKGFGLIGGLPALLTGLVSPASKATGAVKGLNTEMQNLGGAGGTAGGRAARFSTFMTGIASKVNVALAAIVGMQAVVGATTDKFEQSEAGAKRWAAAAASGALAVKNEIGEGVGPNWWEKFAPGGIITSLISGENPFAARDFGQELASDLGGGFNAKMKGFAANVLNIDFGNIGATKDRIAAQFDAISTSLRETGDTETAKKNLEAFEEMLKTSGVEASVYSDALADLKDQIDGVTGASAQAAQDAGGLIGDFSTTKTALATIGTAFDVNVTQKIDAIRKSAQYRDPLTGGLNAAGIKAITDVYKDANFTMINGVNNAIENVDAGRIAEIFTDPANFDKFGNLTKKALEEVAGILPAALKEGEEELLAFQRRLRTLNLSTDAQDVGRTALKLNAPEIRLRDLTAGQEANFGARIIKLRTELEDAGKTTAEIDAIIADRTMEILVSAQTDTAVATLKNWFGEPWETELWLEVPDAKYIEVNNQLMELTKDGKWEAVVDTKTANTIRAKEEVYEVTVGPDGKPHVAKIKTEVDPKSKKKAEEEIKEVTKTSTKWINLRFKTPAEKAAFRKAESLTMDQWSMPVPPPSAPLVPAPSMISMGGPTMGGDGGTGASAFAGGVGISTYASRGRFDSNDPAGMDARDSRRVTVNVVNNYPEPEKASDSIAMSLRIARWELAGA